MEPPTSPATARAQRPSQKSLLAMSAAAATVWLAVLALTSTGFGWQDEYAHLLFSRWMWRHPEVAVDLWGRPLATIVYAPVAVLGVWAPRLLTVAFAVLAAWWTGKAAHARGVPAWVAWAAVLAQPVFVRFSFGALPGTLFALILARLLYEEARGEHARAAWLAALLPLARVEGVLIVAVYAVVLYRRGQRAGALIPFAGLAVWNIAGFAATGEPLFLLTANPYPVTGSIYPRGGWPYLARALPAAAGVSVGLLAIAGVVARARAARLGVEHAMGAAVAVFLTLVWGIPMFASTPTPVYLIGFAPLIALYAADGWERLTRATPPLLVAAAAAAAAVVFVPRNTLGFPSRWLSAPVSGRDRVAFFAACLIVVAAGAAAAIARRPRLLGAGLLVAALVNVAPAATPIPRSPHEQVAVEAATWLAANLPDARVVSVAPDISWEAGADPFIGWEPGALPAQVDQLAGLPPGVVLAWDSEFSPREGGTSLASLVDAGWSEIARFHALGAHVRLLRRG